MNALERAVDKVGGQSKLAKSLGVTPMAVSLWKKRGVPPERCIPIERATGGVVTRYQLRPDVFGAAPRAERAA